MDLTFDLKNKHDYGYDFKNVPCKTNVCDLLISNKSSVHAIYNSQ